MAEVSQAWLDRVKRSQQQAAERLGIDVSEMLAPRDGSTGEAQEPAAATPAPAAQPEPVAAAGPASARAITTTNTNPRRRSRNGRASR